MGEDRELIELIVSAIQKLHPAQQDEIRGRIAIPYTNPQYLTIPHLTPYIIPPLRMERTLIVSRYPLYIDAGIVISKISQG